MSYHMSMEKSYMKYAEFLTPGENYFGRNSRWLRVDSVKVGNSVTVVSTNCFGEEVVERYRRLDRVELNLK